MLDSKLKHSRNDRDLFSCALWVLRQLQCRHRGFSELPRYCEEAAKTELQNATSFESYQKWAGILDELQDHNSWKEEKGCVEPGYDPDLLEAHIQLLSHAAATSDLSALVHHMRTALSRNIGQMNTQGMYKHSWKGTKYLVEEYNNAVLHALDKLVQEVARFNVPRPEVQFLLNNLKDAYRFFGRSALALSGGAKMGMKHIGVVKTLWKADVLPQIITGASAGSIVAAVVCCSTDDDLFAALDRFPKSDLACFDPHGTSALGWFVNRITTFSSMFSFFHMRNMERVLKSWVGELTFQEAYNKTGRILNISVSATVEHEARVLNYITAPNVLIWSAVCASCSVPGVFPSMQLHEKNRDTGQAELWLDAQAPFVDGSLDHDLPIRSVAEMFNVNLFIVSQVNPHVRLLTDLCGLERAFDGRHSSQPWPKSNKMWSSALLIKDVCVTLIDMVKETECLTGMTRYASVLKQEYTGDIDILPAWSAAEYSTMMSNPTPDYLTMSILDGERATWPKIWRIKNHIAIELGLARAITLLQDRIHFGEEAKAVRSCGKRRRGRRRSIQGEAPDFMRGRSMSVEYLNARDLATTVHHASNPPTPVPLRRTLSLKELRRKSIQELAMTPVHPLVLAPQAGLGIFTSSLLVPEHDDDSETLYEDTDEEK